MSLLSGSALILIAGLALARPIAALAASDDVETAALGPGFLGPDGQATMPQPLSTEDARNYRRIFQLEAAGRWAESERYIARLDSKLLLGHVLAKRFLATSSGHTRYADLEHWLDHYADLPEAPEIYELALKRMARGARRPRRPEGTTYSVAIADDGTGEARVFHRRLSAAAERRAQTIRRLLRREIDDHDYVTAKRLLMRPETERVLAPDEFDGFRDEVVSGLTLIHHDQEALALANLDMTHGKRVNPAAEWSAGLAAYRLKHYDDAVHRFERVAMAENADDWTRAAGAYWAGRSHLVNRQPEQVSKWLEIGADYPYTFYGILSRRLMGEPLVYNWDEPALSQADVSAITGRPAGLRAMALVQVGQDELAEQALRRINPNAPELAHALIAVATRADMPALAMQLAQQVFDPEGRHYDAALYPAPSWTPKGGYSVDRALVLALIRQESKFAPTATSPAGARGLMQIMPDTARYMSGARYGGRHTELFDRQTNIELGQDYLTHLMSTDAVGHNLLLIAAAYNGGPGNVARWQREIVTSNDPLMFLESIPSRETRQFVEHVLANYWIYRNELGRPLTSLEAMAQGKWPTYDPSDNYLVPAVALYGGN